MKKFTTIVMTCLIMLVAVLTGCSTFKVDKVKYYNEVLAKVGDECITRFELINAYNSYGYNTYVTQQGQSEKEALLSTMDLLVQRELTAKYAQDNPNKYTLTAYEVNKVYRDTIDSLKDSIKTNMTTARKIYDLELEEDENNADSESKETFKISEYDYEKRVKLIDVEDVVDGQPVTYKQIAYINTDPELDKEKIEDVIASDYINNYKSYPKNEIVEKLLEKFISELTTNENDEDETLYQKVCAKTIELTCNNLINYEYYLRENGKKLSTNQHDLLYRMVERAYESQLQSAYITKVNTVYLQTETLSNQSIINAFKAMYESDYAKYINDTSAYNENIIKTDGDLIYYHPTEDSEFGYFLHVLLPFNNVEDDMNWLKDHRNDLGYSVDEYKAEQIKLINQIMCAQRTTEEVRDGNDEILYEEGITLEEEVPFLEVLAEYEQNVRDLASFKEFMFKYTTDNATLTADMPYVIGYNKTEYTGEIEDNKVVGAYSSMVTNFTAEAIRLMTENQSYTSADEYIITNYGVHLLYYIAPVVNTISVEDINKLTVEKLNNMVLNQATGETYLDRVFDLVYPEGSDGMFTSNTKYSSFEKNLVDSLYAKYPVKLYETKIKASNKI